MEISPISVVRIAPMVRSKQTDLGLTDVFEIERSSRNGDETYSPSDNKAASGSEENADQAGDKNEAENKPEIERSEDEEPREISFFA